MRHIENHMLMSLYENKIFQISIYCLLFQLFQKSSYYFYIILYFDFSIEKYIFQVYEDKDVKFFS